MRDPLVAIYQCHRISEAPAQTVVTITRLISKGKGAFKNYYAEFNYQVDGKDYSFKSIKSSKEAVDRYIRDEKYKSITYAKNAPNIAMPTEHYQLRKKEKPYEIIITVSVISAIVALILTLLVALVIFLIKIIFRSAQE